MTPFTVHEDTTVAGNNTIYNSSSLNCVLELLYRALGVQLDPAFVSYSLDTTNAVLTITALAQAADGRKGIYSGTTKFNYHKLNLGSFVPQDIVYGESYPMTWDRLKTYMKASFDFLLEDGEFYVAGDPNQTPLQPGMTIAVTPNASNGQIQLIATTGAGRWVAGSQLPITITASGAGAPGNHMVASGSAPDGTFASPFSYQYQIYGGVGPYKWSLVSGTLPVSLDQSSGTISTASLNAAGGSYTYTLRCTDAAGRTADITDTILVVAPVGQLQNSLTGDTSILVGTPFTHQYVVTGGIAPYSYLPVGTLPGGMTLSSTGLLAGTLDDGYANFTFQVFDAAGTVIQPSETILPTWRTDAALMTSLRSKLVSWYSNDDGNLVANGTVLDRVSGINLKTTGIATSVPGQDIAAHSFAAAAVATTPAHVYNGNFAVVAYAKNTVVAAGAGILSRWDPTNGGWSMGTSDLDATKLQFQFRSAGVTYKAVSAASLGQATWNMYLAQRDGNQIGLEVNGATYETTPAVATNIDQPGAGILTTMSARSDSPVSTLFGGILDTVMVFNDKLWADERSALWSAGQFLQYQYIKLANAAYQQLTITGSVPASILQGTPCSWTYALSGSDGNYTNARVVFGQMPQGLNFALAGSTLTISGSPVNAGGFNATIAIDGGDGQTNTVLLSGAVTSASLSLSGSFGSGGLVGSSYSSSIGISGGQAPYVNPQVVSGSLPPGLALSVSGNQLVLSGNTTLTGTFTFTAEVFSTDGLSATTNPQTVAVVSSNFVNSMLALNPLAYWRLNEGTTSAGIADMMGNFPATYGTGVKAGGQSLVTGLNDSSVTGNATSYIGQTAASTQFNSKNFSFMAVITPALATSTVVAGMGSRTVFDNQAWLFQANSDGSLAVNYWSDGGSAGASWVTYQTAAAVLTNGQPAIVGFSIATSGTTTTSVIYVNGSPAATWTTSTQPYLPPTNAYPFLIGAQLTGSPAGFFAGGMSQAAIWASTLSASAFLTMAQVAGLAIASKILNKMTSWIDWDTTANAPKDQHANQIPLTFSNVTNSNDKLGASLSPAGTFSASSTSSINSVNASQSAPILNPPAGQGVSALVWAKLTGTQTGTYPKMVWQHAGADYNGYSTFSLGIYGPAGSVPSGSAVLAPWFSSTFSGTNYNAHSNTAMVPGQSYMLAGSNDLTNVKMYVNGQLAGTTPFGGSSILTQGGAPFSIGYGGNSPQDMINAELMPAATFNQALTPQEVNFLYNSGSGLDYPAVVSAAGLVPATTQFLTSNLTVGLGYVGTLQLAVTAGNYTSPSVVSGTMPPGLTLSLSGSVLTLSGTPTAGGTFTFTIGVLLNGVQRLSTQTLTVAPNWYTAWFANGEKGMVFDFNDLTTVYKDTAGTQNVSTVGDSIKAVRCKLTGSLAVIQGSCTMTLDYDINSRLYRGKIGVAATGNGAVLQAAAAAPTAFIGDSSVSLVTVAEFAAGENGVPFYIGPTAPASGNAVAIGNMLDSGWQFEFLQFGVGFGTTTSAVSGIGVAVGTKATVSSTSHNTAIYFNGSKLSANTATITQTANIQTLNADIGRTMASGRTIYACVAIIRALTSTEVTSTRYLALPAPVASITGTFTTNVTVNAAYSSTLNLVGGNGVWGAPTVTSGTLPNGVSLSVVGGQLKLSGTPSSVGSSTFTVRLVTGDGQIVTTTQTVNVQATGSVVFVNDTFTGAAGQLISHTGETGSWLNYGGYNIAYDPTVMMLDGSGNVYAGGSSQQATAVSSVNAPQMDFYAELVVLTGNVPTGASSTSLTLYEHQNTSGLAASFIRGPQVYFNATSTAIYEPDYMVSTGGGDNNVVLATPMPSNHSFTLRVEYRYSIGSIVVYVDGTPVFTMNSANGYAMSGPPTTPGAFAFDIDSYATPSGNGISVSSVKLGTL